MIKNNYNNINYLNNPTFNSEKVEAGILTKPIETVQKTVETGVDIFIKDGDTIEAKKNKKKRNRAIAAGSTVVVLSALTMLLNPRGSAKLTTTLRNLQNKLDVKIKQSKDNFLKTKFYELYKKIFGFVEKGSNVYFNMNSSKDILFQEMCTNTQKKYPNFITKNETVHKIVKAVDNGITKILKKPHEQISKVFERIGQFTVKQNYNKALKEMNFLEETLKLYKDKLPTAERILVENKLQEIAQAKQVFNNKSILSRLAEQDKIMDSIDKELFEKLKSLKNDIFGNGFKDVKKGWESKPTDFWVQEILKTKKAQIEKEGVELVEQFVGGKDKKGLYDEILDIYREHLDKDKFDILNKNLGKVSKKLKKANNVECVEYFDKKRDLKVGGAPTDVVSQLLGLGICSAVVVSADKDKRVSKLLTNGIPILTGLATSLVCTSLLYSGPVGLLVGGVMTGVTNFVCNKINKHVLGNKDEIDEEVENEIQEKNLAQNKELENPAKTQEVKNV